MKRGDISGLETVVRAYQVQALHAAFLVTRDLGLAQEVVQAAFVKAYDRTGQFQSGRPFGPWFLRAVLRDATKAAVKRKRHAPLDMPEGDPTSKFPDLSAGPEELW